MVFMKNLKFFQLFVLYKIHREKVFADVLVRKQDFLDNKNMHFKRRQSGIIPKGLVHDFRPKLEISSKLILMQNKPRKSIYGRSS